MNDTLKSLGASLRHVYDTIARKPMPWRMIDALTTLEETCEQREAREKAGRRAQEGDAPAPSNGDVRKHD